MSSCGAPKTAFVSPIRFPMPYGDYFAAVVDRDVGSGPVAVTKDVIVSLPNSLRRAPARLRREVARAEIDPSAFAFLFPHDERPPIVGHRHIGLSLLRTPSTAQSLMFARSGSSWPTPMHHLLYALLATAGSSLKPQRELALQTLASRQQLTTVLRTASHRARYPSVEGWNRSGFTRDCGVPRFR
jgi:hypothetical protein